MSVALRTINLNVISDSICPFCYLGYKKVLAAQEMIKQKMPDVQFKMKFSPFLLDPTLPEDHSVSKRERYTKKFGKEKIEPMEKAMIERGKAYGINFSYGGSIRQTTDSHRLLSKAYEQGGEALQRNILERLFAGYFEQEKDIGDREWLATESESAGLGTKEEILKFLESDLGKKEVAAEIEHAQDLNVSGVPFFVIDDKYAVSGAQEPETFARVFEQILAKQ